MRCDECRFWRCHTEQRGSCVRRAPVLIGDTLVACKSEIEPEDPLAAAWPITAPSDWCGEFQPADHKPGCLGDHAPGAECPSPEADVIRTLAAFPCDGIVSLHSIKDVAEKVMLDEREACAKLAEQTGLHFTPSTYDFQVAELTKEIATAIRGHQ